MFSSRIRVAAITRSSRRVMACTTSAGGSARWAGRDRARPPAGRGSVTATTRCPEPPWVLTGCTASACSAVPAAVSSVHRNSRVWFLRAAAASWVAAVGLAGRSIKAVNNLPVAYPGPEPSSSPAAALTRRIVPSAPSRNRGTGACWKTACSSRRSAWEESEPPLPGSASVPLPAAVSAATAASNSASAASSSGPGSAPGSAAACRSAAYRALSPVISLPAPWGPGDCCFAANLPVPVPLGYGPGISLVARSTGTSQAPAPAPLPRAARGGQPSRTARPGRPRESAKAAARWPASAGQRVPGHGKLLRLAPRGADLKPEVNLPEPRPGADQPVTLEPFQRREDVNRAGLHVPVQAEDDLPVAVLIDGERLAAYRGGADPPGSPAATAHIVDPDHDLIGPGGVAEPQVVAASASVPACGLIVSVKSEVIEANAETA